MASRDTSLPEDVEPVLGEEAIDYQKLIVDGVRSQLDGDEARLNEFVAMTRNYGKGEASAEEFWVFLANMFGEGKAYRFLPKLARLIADDDKRRALLKSPPVVAAGGRRWCPRLLSTRVVRRTRDRRIWRLTWMRCLLT